MAPVLQPRRQLLRRFRRPLGIGGDESGAPSNPLSSSGITFMVYLPVEDWARRSISSSGVRTSSPLHLSDCCDSLCPLPQR